ncbi:hypothetical protein BD289DRAFT_12757 [Coniella lustricola]|uniref:Uncharacterized protein n=1 Tax=Coniella lustricola TaxID=2025994 RepID=A0A2T3A4C3_9PEZI|nr:hypothetical protein BD289DRAFT_12757 [Coniella lustricola]
MLTTASQAIPRARALRSRTLTNTRALDSAGLSRCQQVRGFRFSLWNVLTDEFRRDAYQQRKRDLEREYVKKYGQRFPWAKPTFYQISQETTGHVHLRYKGSSCSSGDLKKQQSPPNPEGLRPGQNIEDVERGAMDNLVFGHKSESQPAARSRESDKASAAESSTQVPYSGPVEPEDFIIDPITNRKVFKSPNSFTNTNGSIPVKTKKNKNARNRTEEPSASHISDGEDPLHVDLLKDSPLESANFGKIDNGHRVSQQEQLKAAIEKVHSQFGDLGPPSPETPSSLSDNAHKALSKWTHKSVLRQIRAGIKEGLKSHDDLYKKSPLTSDTSSMPLVRPRKEASYSQAHIPSETFGEPSGCTVSSPPPDKSFQSRSHFERLEPVDFPPSTVKDLRIKYGQNNLKQYTVTRKIEATTKMPSAEMQNLRRQGGPGPLNTKKQIEHSSARPLQDRDGEAPTEHENFKRTSLFKRAEEKQSNYREMLDSLMEQHVRLSDAADLEASRAVKMASAKVQQSTAQPKMTGNYVRDFPEEFEKSWTETLATIPQINENGEYEGYLPSEKMDGGLEGGFGQPKFTRIQPALDRHSTKAPRTESTFESLKDDESKASPHSEHPALVEQSSNPAASMEARATPMKEPTKPSANTGFQSTDYSKLYKILAYDPTMQKVNVAETTSLVADFASALSPADALLRLSHPTKFFPHFAALEAEGFEIVSGSGDVLVFRKVRPSSSNQTGENFSESKPDRASFPALERRSATTTINPIDMTGRNKAMSPASANFASPTGYVAYENLPENEVSNLPPPPPPPRVKYNINVRREEPVYSGPKEQTGDQQKRKKRPGVIKRMLLGGAWVAGISYGLGVLTEYFTTGGVDGKGPSGF